MRLIITKTEPIPRLSAHAVADLFPMLPEEDLAKLAEDIRINGQLDHIIIHQAQILDGRNRYAACELAGVTPKTAPFDGKDPIAFVLSKNLHRRQLTESQRGMVAARMTALFEAEAKARMVASLKKGDEKPASANLREREYDGKASTRAAKVMNVSTRTVETACKVLREAAPEVVAAVDRGDVKVSAAAVLATLPKSEQRQAVKDGSVREVVRDIRVAANDAASRSHAEEGAAVHEDGEMANARMLPFDEFHERSVHSWLAAVFLELMRMTPAECASGVASVLTQWSGKFEKKKENV